MSPWAVGVIRTKGPLGHTVLSLASSLDPIPTRVLLQLCDKCRIIVDAYGNGPSFKRIFYYVSTSAARTDILLPVVFNDAALFLICKVFACTKCGCFYRVDFSGFILFEVTLKGD
jgi:hypothetical protein